MSAFSSPRVGSTPAPQLPARVLGGLAKGGLPSCKGEPAPFVLPNATDTLASVARPPASAPPVTKLLAEFVAGIRYEHIPPGPVAPATAQLKSTLGTMSAGSRMPPGQRFARA